MIRICTIFVLSLCLQSAAFADLLCVKNVASVKSSRASLSKVFKVVRTSRCPSGFTRVINTDSFKGADGSSGANGQDGSLAIYGDGSSGDVVFSSSAAFDAPLAQYNNCTVNSGVTLTLSHGTTMRCAGSITINGTINIEVGEYGGLLEAQTPAVLGHPAIQGFTSSIARAPAQHPEYGNNGNDRFGGRGATAWGSNTLKAIINPGLRGGSTGSGALVSSSTPGLGGGVVRIISRGIILISASGQITANGTAGGVGAGGGAGGVIILGSKTSISNSGSISALGANGGSSDALTGVGGGGGGGIIHFVAPSIVAGTTDVSGGSAGTNTGNVTANPRSAGGGGGASGGSGGFGASVLTTNSQTGQQSGTDGVVFQSTTDPTIHLL
jgi:hypothetical protein